MHCRVSLTKEKVAIFPVVPLSGWSVPVAVNYGRGLAVCSTVHPVARAEQAK